MRRQSKNKHNSIIDAILIVLVIISLIGLGLTCLLVANKPHPKPKEREVKIRESRGRELVAPLSPTITPTPVPEKTYLSFFMSQTPVTRAERDNTFSMDIYFPDKDTSDEVGCALALLQRVGYVITAEDLISNYVHVGELETKNDVQLYGDHPIDAFIGDPRSDTGTSGAYVDVMMTAVQEYLWDEEAPYTVLNLKNQTIEQLDDLILGRNTPVCIWTTLGKYDTQGDSWLTTEAGELFTWDSRTKCMILTGYDGDYEIVGDPTTGSTEEYATHVVTANYDNLARMAYAIVPKDDVEITSVQVPARKTIDSTYEGTPVDYNAMYGY